MINIFERAYTDEELKLVISWHQNPIETLLSRNASLSTLLVMGFAFVVFCINTCATFKKQAGALGCTSLEIEDQVF